MAYLLSEDRRQARGALPRADLGLNGPSQLLRFPPVATEDAH